MNNPTTANDTQGKTASQRSFTRPKREHGALRAVLAATLFVPLIAIAGFLIMRIQEPAAKEQAPAVDLHDMGVGSVVQQIGRAQCELMTFDNYTGRTIENARRCKETIILDAHGIPVPTGTVRRLDSISKSFMGDNR